MLRSDWRSFRIDRLASPAPTGAVFVPRQLPAGDAATFVRAGIHHLPTRLDVEVLVHADAPTVRSRIGRWAMVEAIDATRCVLPMTADSPDWVLFTLGAIGAEFDVRSPPELLDYASAWTGRMVRAVDRRRPPGTGGDYPR